MSPKWKNNTVTHTHRNFRRTNQSRTHRLWRRESSKKQTPSSRAIAPRFPCDENGSNSRISCLCFTGIHSFCCWMCFGGPVKFSQSSSQNPYEMEDFSVEMLVYLLSYLTSVLRVSIWRESHCAYSHDSATHEQCKWAERRIWRIFLVN